MISYRLEIVGGPYDGVPGFAWNDDGEHPPPEAIWIGACRGDESCELPWCPGRSHPAFWTSDEDVPVRTVEYEKESDFVEPGPGYDGTARYAVGGLRLSPTRVEEELVPAGEGGVYAHEIVRHIAERCGVPRLGLA